MESENRNKNKNKKIRLLLVREFSYINNTNREENNSKQLPDMSFQNKQCHQVPCKMNKIEYKAQHHEILEHLNKKKNSKIEEIKCF